ncbi:pilus assembly FimT family protein [Dongshaea marina]|uniref:pilus assembly FimT family protein n=1 Tax=Dongshaea marina TaxID=2047966 RepID=UPI000D3E897C|nr:prepilin-type N-terminal cleavage/methylation domain-containing protein [Dongshaea marina]
MRRHKGFTLLELTTCIIIASVLAASGSFYFKGALGNARKALLQDTAHTFKQDLALIELLESSDHRQPNSAVFDEHPLKFTHHRLQSSSTNIQNLLEISPQDWNIQPGADHSILLTPRGTSHPESCYIKYAEIPGKTTHSRVQLPASIRC